MKQLFVLLSIAVTVAAAVTVVAAVIWVIETIRHRNSKAKPILKVAALITIACFAGTGITYALGGTPEPKQTPNSIEQLQEPVQNLEPKPEDDSPSSSPTTPPELTETLEDAAQMTEMSNPLSALDVQEHPVMNGFKTERIGTWASIATTKEFLSSATDEQLFQYLNEIAENQYNWINIFFEDGTGLYCMGSGGYLLEYGNVDQDEGGAVEYIEDMDDCIYTFTDGKYSTEKGSAMEPQPEDKSEPTDTLIEVTFTVSVDEEVGRPKFVINTNLPDETELILTLNGDENYTAQDKVVVENGTAVTTAFSNKGDPLSGKYTVDISMSIPKLQSDNVRAVIGEKGENITGPYVEKSDIFGENMVYGKSVAEFEF